LKILFIVNKDLKLSEFVQLTGIRQQNMWFDYFMQKFMHVTVIVDFSALIIHCNAVLSKTSVPWQVYFNQFGVDGDTFINKKCWMLDYNVFDIDFQTLLSSKKVKVMTIDD